MNEKQVLKEIGEDRWDEFFEWMTGQTVGMNKDGTADYYETDVNRFLRGGSSMHLY